MLRNGCFSNRQFFVYITEEATILFCQKSKNSHPCRMPHCFGKTSNLFLLCCVLFLFHFNSPFLFVVRKTTNNILNSQILQHIFFG